MEPQNWSNFPGLGPEVLEKKSFAKERAAQRVRNWTVRNGTKDVPGWMTAGAARRMLDFVDSREERVQQNALPIAAKTREDTSSISFSVETKGTCVSKNLDETVRL